MSPSAVAFHWPPSHWSPPSAALRALVSHYWLARGGDPHTILPDGCVDLVWHLEQRQARWLAFGTTTQATLLDTDADTVYLGIRLLPGQNRHFPGLPGAMLTDTQAPLPRFAGLDPDSLAELSRQQNPFRLLDRALTGWLHRHPPEPHRLDRALALIHQRGPVLDVTSLSDHAGVGRRQLERDFHTWLGVSPKTYLGIRRGQYALARLTAAGGRLADIALDAGYADQSHMTRELKRLMGVTPGAPTIHHQDVAFIQEHLTLSGHTATP